MRTRTRLLVGMSALLALAATASTAAFAANDGHNGKAKGKPPPTQYAFAFAAVSGGCGPQNPQLPPATCTNSPFTASRTGAIDVAGTVTPGTGPGAALNVVEGVVSNTIPVPAGATRMTFTAAIDVATLSATPLSPTSTSRETGFEWLCVQVSSSVPCTPFNVVGTSPFNARMQLFDTGFPALPQAPFSVTVPVVPGQVSLTVEAGLAGYARLGDCPGQGISAQVPCLGDATPIAIELAGTVRSITATAQ